MVELRDKQNVIHNLQVQILGTEETWNTPSLLLATDPMNGGKAVFSQVSSLEYNVVLWTVIEFDKYSKVHLETNPNSYEQDEVKYGVLMQYEQARLEILMDLLRTYLDIKVKDLPKNGKDIGQVYANGYFLGDHKVSATIFSINFFLFKSHRQISGQISIAREATHQNDRTEYY